MHNAYFIIIPLDITRLCSFLFCYIFQHFIIFYKFVNNTIYEKKHISRYDHRMLVKLLKL